MDEVNFLQQPVTEGTITENNDDNRERVERHKLERLAVQEHKIKRRNERPQRHSQSLRFGVLEQIPLHTR